MRRRSYPHVCKSMRKLTEYTFQLFLPFQTHAQHTMSNRDLPTTLCRGITRQVLATVPLRARLNGRPVVAGLPVPTDDLVPIAGGPS